MTTPDVGADRCPKCQVKVTARMRHCLACYAPLKGADTRRRHLDTVKEVATTHRPDPTVIDLPEVREAWRAQKRRRKRLLIAGAISLTVIAVLALSLYQWNRKQQQNQRRMARQQAAVKELRLLAAGLESFCHDFGRYPTAREGIESLTNRAKVVQAGNPDDAYQWHGPYVEGNYELDPWGNDYHYEVTPDGQAFQLFSDGPPGESGGEPLRISSPPQSEH